MLIFYVVITVILFLGVDIVLVRLRARRLVAASGTVAEASARPLQQRMPDGVLFARSHTWVNPLRTGLDRVGVDDFVTDLMERAGVTLVNNEGDRVKRGDPMLVLTRGGQALAVRSPISGEVVSVNRPMEGPEGLAHPNDFTGGWVYTIRPDRPEELRALLAAGETRSWMSGEMQRLRDFFSDAAAGGFGPAAMQDGGTAAPGALLNLGPEAWSQFEQEFLQEDARASEDQDSVSKNLK